MTNTQKEHKEAFFLPQYKWDSYYVVATFHSLIAFYQGTAGIQAVAQKLNTTGILLLFSL